jgi:Asp/Glu/hydantoin racemase
MSAHHPEPAIIVVNPNSSETVTDGMDRALADLRRPDGPAIRCITLAEGPPGIETDRHISEVIAPLVRLVERLDPQALAFVDACFSDPGLAEIRRATGKPVFGIAETAYRRAAANGGRFGVLSIQEGSLARHRRYIGALGLTDYLAGDRPVGLGVTALGDDPAATLVRLVQVGRQLKDSDGAQTIVLGCTGMAPFREQLQTLLDLPVLDPVLAAAEAAIEAVASPDGGL